MTRCWRAPGCRSSLILCSSISWLSARPESVFVCSRLLKWVWLDVRKPHRSGIILKCRKVRQINTSWHINAISDGQRRRRFRSSCFSLHSAQSETEQNSCAMRRCQLLECLAEEKKARWLVDNCICFLTTLED